MRRIVYRSLIPICPLLMPTTTEPHPDTPTALTAAIRAGGFPVAYYSPESGSANSTSVCCYVDETGLAVGGPNDQIGGELESLSSQILTALATRGKRGKEADTVRAEVLTRWRLALATIGYGSDSYDGWRAHEILRTTLQRSPRLVIFLEAHGITVRAELLLPSREPQPPRRPSRS